MTNKQKIEIRVSEVRQRLNAIAGLGSEDFTDEIRNESATLQTEYGDLEIRHRAAIISEGEEESRMAGQFGGGGEGAEVRALLDRVHVSDYLTRAAAGTGVDGGAAELNERPSRSRLPDHPGAWLFLGRCCYSESNPDQGKPSIGRSPIPAIMPGEWCRGQYFNGCSGWTYSWPLA